MINICLFTRDTVLNAELNIYNNTISVVDIFIYKIGSEKCLEISCQ